MCTLALTMIVVNTSCDKHDYPDEPYYPWEPGTGEGGGQGTGGSSGDSGSFWLSPSELKFDVNGSGLNVYINQAKDEVTVTSKPSWINYTKYSSTQFIVKATKNTGAERSGNMVFYSGGKTVTLYITQAGNSGTGGTGSGSTNQKPNAPTGLTASPDGPSTAPFALIRWNSVAGATKYLVYRSTSTTGSYSQIKSVTIASCSDETVQYGKTYYYKVKASNSYGTSDFSDYATCAFTDKRTPGPVQYGNCIVSGSSMTLRWSVPKDPSYGTPTEAVLRVMNPDTKKYIDLQKLSGTATSVSFVYSPYIDKDGYVRAGIVLINKNGSGGGLPKVYDTKNKKWIN